MKIRTQDGRMLLECVTIKWDFFGAAYALFGVPSYGGNELWLGTYRTKKECLTVLDTIQNFFEVGGGDGVYSMPNSE